ncbi:MAG: gamma-glutamyltransferase [Verrucomicrobia bacterium]|nr:gamma-glutamyltransferase [Verrucomicrobiota bacterium]
MQSLIAEPTEAQDRTQARSMAVSRGGIVASEHPLASQAGATILAEGGNAIDAAIAANATMGVVAPMMCGIGGDLFAIVYEAKSGKVYGLNASGWAAQGLSIEFLKSKGFAAMPSKGIHSVTVPGAVEGLEKLNRRFGKKKLADVLAPAIHFAEKGFPVTELDAEYWAGGESLLRKDENATRTYLPNGRPPRLGEIYRNEDLAKSYRRIAAKGRDGFYQGETARHLVEYSIRQGGTIDADDLAKYSCEWVEPISTTYHGWTVYEIPPNGQGIAALTMLNLMENFPLAEYGHNSVTDLHVMIEAKKLAYADMLRYVADPKFSKIPVAGILSKEYGRQRAKLIDMDKANCHVEAGTPPAAGNETTYLCAVDRDGNIVSLIQSNYGSFGSGLVPDQCGFVLQNRGGLFSLDPKSPNHLVGHKRPLHTIIPAMMAKGDLRIAFGIMGGWNQSQAHAQFVSNVADHKMNLQSALEAPRFSKGSFEGCDVAVESRILARVIEALTAKGHQVQVKGSFSQTVGGGQAVMRDFSAGVNYGASDPRKDGAAIPEPLLKK